MADNIKLIANNKKAYHDYFVEDKFEVGIELVGTEVKSLRLGQVNLKDSWCTVDGGEMFVCGMHISPYEKGNIFNRDSLRVRKLLLHKKEIMQLFGLVGREGYSIIPLQIYFKNSRAKLEIGLCKGKKLYDKRDSAAEKDMKRQSMRNIKLSGRIDE